MTLSWASPFTKCQISASSHTFFKILTFVPCLYVVTQFVTWIRQQHRQWYNIFILLSQGTFVLLAIHDLHNGDHWTDAASFRPERFLTKEGNLIQDDWLMPFGSGNIFDFIQRKDNEGEAFNCFSMSTLYSYYSQLSTLW